jgi:Zn-dependent M28 family amino/carboxypeptidase
MTSAKRSFRFTRFLSLLAIVVVALILMIAWLTVQPNIPFRDGMAPAPASLARDDELPARLERHVRTLVTQFAPRDHEHVAQLDDASTYIEGELAKHATTRFQNFNANGNSYRNVIAQLGPETNEIIVIGAHYDSYRALPAADDNASGVAGLIELAQILSKIPLNKRVELVAYTLEEPPYFRTEFMGSAIHAKLLKASNRRVSLMLSLECIGYFSDAPNSQDFPISAMGLAYPKTGNFIALVGHYREDALSRRVREKMRAATPLPVHSINAPAFVAGIDFSDHLNYWNEGFVGMMVTDTAFMRNKNYHTAGDTPDTLDYRRMGDVVRAVASVVRDVGGEVAVESR